MLTAVFDSIQPSLTWQLLNELSLSLLTDCGFSKSHYIPKVDKAPSEQVERIVTPIFSIDLAEIDNDANLRCRIKENTLQDLISEVQKRDIKTYYWTDISIQRRGFDIEFFACVMVPKGD